MSQNEIVSETNYYPFGLAHKGYNEHVSSTNKGEDYKFNGKEHQNEFGINFTDYGWRNYMSDIGRWISPDPLTEEFSDWSPYNYGMNNPVRYIDVDGLYSTEEWKKDNGITDDDLIKVDWVAKKDGSIVWEDNVTSANDTDLAEGDTYLGKNVLVATHNRDASGNEKINSAKFDLYLESDKTGSTASINGNTVPADTEKYGTLAEGLYSAQYYANYKGDGAILIGEGKGLPTLRGNPNNPLNYNANGLLKPIGQHVMDNILFHKGNWARKSLSKLDGTPISAGCQTGGCGEGSLSAYRRFIKNTEGFVGGYFLRSNPK